MKLLPFLFLSLALAAGSCAAGIVEDFCAQFAGGAEVRVFRGFTPPALDRDMVERAQKAGCVVLLGETFYPDTQTLPAKDAAAWLARATSPDSYYPSATAGQAVDTSFHADIAFWCVTPDHKNEAYCLASFATSQVLFSIAGKEATVTMTFELEKISREILLRTFEREVKAEKNEPAQNPRS